MDSNSCILIIEDSDDDYDAFTTALGQDNNLANPIKRCVTGDGALDYLFSRGVFAEAPQQRPCFILLDLNLPGSDGHEVLMRIKTDSTLKSIPVVVMTSSRDEADIEACYGAGANSYVVKPSNLEGFLMLCPDLKNIGFKFPCFPLPSVEVSNEQ